MGTEPLDVLKQRLESAYPGWHFFRGNKGTGDLMATRKAHITDDLVNAGLARSLPMGIGHNVSLEAQIAEQARIEESLDEGGSPMRAAS